MTKKIRPALQDVQDIQDIKDQGIDFDPENNPVYPMKRHRDTDRMGMSWQRPSQQKQDVEILRSIERPGLSAVYGTSSPPSGLSGMIRRLAFRSSESTYARWLPLMLADRINMVEGILSDLWRGHVPNIFAEMGMKSEMKYNKRGFLIKSAIGTGTIIGLIALYRRRKEAK